MKLAIFLVGIPASGKTTQRNAMAGTPYVSMDEIRKELTGSISDQTRNKEVSELAFKRWADLLEANPMVILDNTNYNRKNRKKFLQIAKSHGAICQAFVFFVTLEEAKRRNANREVVVPEHVIERMYNNFEYPTAEEGFDVIQRF